jgi:hypothetical protein
MIDNTQNVIDSRDILDRIEELEYMDNLTEDESSEIRALKEIVEQCEECSDWKYGEALIRESFFTEYAQQLVEDCATPEYRCGAPLPNMTEWPWNVKGAITINWELIAESLKQDYEEVNFDGVIYYISP